MGIHKKIVGFATAKGSLLKISNESLKKAKLIFGDDLGTSTDNEQPIKKRKVSGDRNRIILS